MSAVEDRLGKDDWPVIVQCYRDFISNHIRAPAIISRMNGCFNTRVDEEVTTLGEQGKNIDAADALLKHLLDQTGKSDDDIKARWSAFNQALEKESPMVHEVIYGKCSAEDLEQQRSLVHYFMRDISRRVNAEELLPLLMQERLLNLKAGEFEAFCARARNDGPTMAMVYLVSRIHRSRSDWYSKFLGILMPKYSELVQHIDPMEYEKKFHLTHASGSISDVQESPMEVSSDSAHVPTPLYAGAQAGTSGITSSTHNSDSHGLATIGRDPENGQPAQKTRKLCEFDYSTANSAIAIVRPMEIEANTVPPPLNNCSVVPECHNTATSVQHKHLENKNIPTADSDEEMSNAVHGAVDGENAVEMEDTGRELKLRGYQQELAEKALAGKNVIICAPTGSGKTEVACKIIQNHLQQKEGASVRKVVFLVDKVALADQQHKKCDEYLKPLRCKLVSGDMNDSDKVPLSYLIEKSDVLVMTAQILLDALEKKEVLDIGQFSMLVFDECHHTRSRHPYNSIMHHYMAAKFPPDSTEQDEDYRCPLPQVVGLTASVGVGKAGNKEAAKKHIQTLGAHLDVDPSQGICTVSRNIQELGKFTNTPEYENHDCSGRPDDKFKKKIEEIMKTIEENMENAEYTQQIQDADFRAKLRPPSARGTDQYTSWVSQLHQNVAKSSLLNETARASLQSSRRMLEFYNGALVINNDFDTEDALTNLKSQFQKLYDVIDVNRATTKDIDRFFKDLFEKNIPYLESVSKDPSNCNPKLVKLEDMLVRKFSAEPDSRAMIFVRTKVMASALVQWMLRRPQLKPMNPLKITGAGESAEQGGMTKVQQVDVIKGFGEGKNRILVATSVAEEGLDIQECNMVIRYSYSSNEIAMMQARGRARAENSKFVELTSKDKGTQQKEQVNLIREMMMRAAIVQLQEEMQQSPEKIKQQMEAIQKEEKKKRDDEKKWQRGRTKIDGEVQLLCRHCDCFGCMSSEIRVAENKHHVVIDQTFRERFDEKVHPRPVSYDSMQMKYKLFCKKCGHEWGNANIYKDAKFPVIMIHSFVVRDDFGKRDTPRKWKDTRFPIQELTPQELDEYRRQAMEAGYGPE